jgi:hypothetical protein
MHVRLLQKGGVGLPLTRRLVVVGEAQPPSARARTVSRPLPITVQVAGPALVIQRSANDIALTTLKGPGQQPVAPFLACSSPSSLQLFSRWVSYLVLTDVPSSAGEHAVPRNLR